MDTSPLYQGETKKALENFQISGVPFSLSLAKSIAMIKHSTAKISGEIGTFSPEIAHAIMTACQEVIEEKWNKEFVVDQIQGGAGTSMHMNVNEVIASRATELLGNGTRVHPNDHVNHAQSTNDVIPTAIKVSTLQLLDILLPTYENFCAELEKKSREYEDIIKVGRTHLQDAVPITVGQEFAAHAFVFRKDILRLHKAKEALYEINLGGSAIGTALTGSRRFIDGAAKNLSEISGYPFFPSSNLIAATQYADAFLDVAGVLSTLSANMIKFMNDLRLLTSGPCAGIGELQFAEIQKGSSIMPGKVNPVMAEMMNQICFQVLGNNQTILFAVQAGQLELNVMLPIVAKNLFESLTILNNGLRQFILHALIPLQANRERCQEIFEKSLCMGTALSPKIGYDKTAALVKEAVQTKQSLKNVILKNNFMTDSEYQDFFNPKDFTEIKE